ncbi:LacI family DNA-binding transcriptional regulator [Sporosarcina pasteurii]|uniref:Maltose operon transcriptional repressor n=1 Tax=Sporosarcina pasteurii TaxID=1474 RepID=A0A380BF73_SPOPA|nr:LacI family DNA-binding transcriptional regulator [Sporosarcina pasteurii]MDS9472516.1 LacI family DNA-binding transcriptional regulator [Sporosarcina pasteurii]QBQ06069.1 LacI family transcriptional regulator [Sporosarcina pasteurii]SUI99524.1 Maltose operon transcriptional repressor [Sporosarcina pasteurii]
MSVTIRDVAKAANVAPSTVSRVISDSPHISDKTKRKVQKVMEELGYHLNYNARNLAQQSTKTIGIVVKHSTQASMYNTFFPEVIAGISALCSKFDFSISLTTGESEEEIYNDTVKMVRGKKVDGMIVLYSKEDDKVVPYLVESNIPFVVIGKPVHSQGQITYVDNDNVQAAKEATTYLFDLGHKDIAFIGEDNQFEVDEARLNGYLSALNEKNIPIKEEYIKNLKFDAEEGRKIAGELLDLVEPPTALVVANDLNALVMLTALSEKNIRVPYDMSIICFNNSVLTQVSNPPLTTMDTHIFQLGHESASCLIELINEPSTFNKSIIVPTLMIERQSCKQM